MLRIGTVSGMDLRVRWQRLSLLSWLMTWPVCMAVLLSEVPFPAEIVT